MDTIKKKLTSRKLWIALAGVVVGLAAIMGAGEAEIATVAGAITATASAVAYIVTEGRIDAAAVGNAAQAVQDALDVFVEDVPETEPEPVAAAPATTEKELKPPPANAASLLASIVAVLTAPEGDAEPYEGRTVTSIRTILREAGVDV